MNQTTTTVEQATWTLVYRVPRGRIFRPVTGLPETMTWAEANHAAGKLLVVYPDVEIWTTTAKGSAGVGPEDVDNIMLSNGKLPGTVRWDAKSDVDAAVLPREELLPEPAVDSSPEAREDAPADVESYPYTAEDGSLRWACCDSAIGPKCQHVADEDPAGETPAVTTVAVTVELTEDALGEIVGALAIAETAGRNTRELADRIAAAYRQAAGEAIGSLPAPIGRTRGEELGDALVELAHQQQAEVVETARAKYAGTVRHNYCTLPTEDVVILPDTLRCRTCSGRLVRVEDVRTSNGHHQKVSAFIHETSETELNDVYPYLHEVGRPAHLTEPSVRCPYCHTDDPGHVTFVRASYSDETRCTRCGGVSGFAIGD